MMLRCEPADIFVLCKHFPLSVCLLLKHLLENEYLIRLLVKNEAVDLLFQFLFDAMLMEKLLLGIRVRIAFCNQRI